MVSLNNTMAELIHDFIKSLEKELTCSICDDIFTEPKQLHCLHSFCCRCIEKWNETCKNRRQRLTCPACRSREDGDVSKLRSSFYLDSLKQLLFAMRNRASKPEDNLKVPNCASCQEHAKSVAYCPQCQGMICTDCVNAHKKVKQLRDQHPVIMLSDFKQEHVKSYIANQIHCEEKYHEKQKLEYFCEACQKCICVKCSNTSHGTHERISMEEKADEIKRLINDNMHRVNQLKQRFVQKLELSKQNIERVENEVNTAKKAVSDHVQTQIQILRDYENATTKALDEMFQEQKTANDQEQSELKTVVHQLDAVNDQVQALHDRNVAYIILQSKLPERCEELLQTPSVLSSKPNKRNASIRYLPNTQVTLSLQNIGRIVESVTDPSRSLMEINFKPVKVFGEQGDGKKKLANPQSIAVNDTSGEVAIVDRGHNRIVVFSSDGTYLRQFGREGTGDGALCDAVGVVTYDNRLFVTDNPNECGRLQEFDVNNGAYLGTIYRQKGVRLTSMTLTDQNIAVCWRHVDVEETQLSGIKVFNKQSGHLVQEFPLLNARPLSIVYSNNRYFISFPYHNHIGVYDENGIFLYKFGEEGKRGGQLNCCIGLDVYDRDYVIVSDSDNHRVQVFTQEGQFITSFGSYGSGIGQMDRPVDVVATPDGKVLVLEFGGNRVQVWQ